MENSQGNISRHTAMCFEFVSLLSSQVEGPKVTDYTNHKYYFEINSAANILLICIIYVFPFPVMLLLERALEMFHITLAKVGSVRQLGQCHPYFIQVPLIHISLLTISYYFIERNVGVGSPNVSSNVVLGS